MFAELTTADFLIIVVATWYAAHAVTGTSGPFALFVRLRRALPLGGLVSCIVCFAPWAALVLWALYLTPARPAVVVLAIAGAALMLGAWTGARHVGEQQ